MQISLVRSSVTILFFFLSIACFAQENFLEGKIITLKGDTINGLIDYRFPNITPSEITFKTSEDKTQKHSTKSIKGFIVGKEVFESKLVNIEKSGRNTSNISTSRELDLEKTEVFLKVLFKGTKSLYYYQTPSRQENFYFSYEDSIRLLVYKKFKIGPNILENKKYLGQLSLYLGNCSSIKNNVAATKYSLKSLSKLFSDYYECTSETIIFQNERGRTEFQYAIYGGLSLTSLKFKSNLNSFNYLTQPDAPFQPSFSVGFRFNVVFSGNLQKWVLVNELQYSQFSTELQYLDQSTENVYTTYDSEITCNQLAINNLMRYHFYKKKNALYVNLGTMVGFAISKNSNKTEVQSVFNVQQTVSEPAINMAALEFGILTGVGYTINNHFFTEVRAGLGSGFTDRTLELSSHTKRLYFLIGYTF